MFKRAHHQHIAKILAAINSDLLQEAQCFFGGGTAIVLSLDEYRESLDIDFLCSSNDGYRLLRNAVSRDLGQLLRTPIKHLRQVSVDRDAIRTVLEVDGTPIKIEFLKEGNTDLQGSIDPLFQVPTLSRVDMYTQKLLANADRGLDKATMSRDLIDLSMMIARWGDIPDNAWEKAHAAYGPYLIKGFYSAVRLTQDLSHLKNCLHKMHMNEHLVGQISEILDNASSRICFTEEARQERDKRIAALPTLAQFGGATFTFWRHAEEAIKSSGAPENVNWPTVEKQTIALSIGEYGQSPESVVEALCRHSPGCISAERKMLIQAGIERMEHQPKNTEWQPDGGNKSP